MKAIKGYLFIGFLAFTLLTLSFKPVKPPVANNNKLQSESASYPDGLYEGKSRDGYTSEPYWGHVKIKVENGALTTVNFMIRDSSRHECVDSLYGIKHYTAYPAYQLQCVKDGNGIKIYPQKLIQTQDMEEVDAISGATWSYRIFKASVKEALPASQTGIIQGNDADNVSVKVFPNPFDAGVVIEYHLITKSQVDLSIFTEEGKLIRQLVNEVQPLGSYSVRWEDCPVKGMYLYRLTVGKTAFTGTLLGLKE